MLAFELIVSAHPYCACEVMHRLRALALRRSESRNCGLCVVYIQKYGATLVGAWFSERVFQIGTL